MGQLARHLKEQLTRNLKGQIMFRGVQMTRQPEQPRLPNPKGKGWVRLDRGLAKKQFGST